MGSGEINVAYAGTVGDLGSSDTADMFTYANDSFDFDMFHDGSDGVPASDLAAAGPPTGKTISPKDVFNNESFPPSTSFTNLTTPGSTYLDTPDDSFETSPMYENVDSNKFWPSLFPEEDATTTVGGGAPDMVRSASGSSASQLVVHPGGTQHPRKRSSTVSPPNVSPSVRHSSVAGVASRKRDKPLPPIVVNESDAVALKRARNTAAARKSRAKKVEEHDRLMAEINDLKSQVAHWKALALGQRREDE